MTPSTVRPVEVRGLRGMVNWHDAETGENLCGISLAVTIPGPSATTLVRAIGRLTRRDPESGDDFDETVQIVGMTYQF